MNPWLHGFLWGAVVITVIMTLVAWTTWFERKFVARMQSRVGPTIVGPAGLLQPIADGLKMLQKEDIVPVAADRKLFVLAPLAAVFLALAVAAAVPFSPGLLAADLDIGLLYVLAFSGLMVFPVWVGSWASNNKYALLGGMRAVAQGISYEIPLVMVALVPVIMADSLSLSAIVEYQRVHGWIAFWPPGPGFLAFIIYMLAALAESNRIPFDIPEAESELVAGPTTEYVGMKFGMFATAEYVHSLLGAALGVVLFLGGWDGPFAPGLHWMVLKTLALFVFIFWLRWTLLRYRSDQLMKICWTYLVPASLGVLMLTALWKHAF